MTYEEFARSAQEDVAPPPSLPQPLVALWHAHRGDWETAHTVAQEIASRDGSWIHAYLHREEGDIGNARYWYSRSAHAEHRGDLAQEREEITRALLGE